MKELHQHLKRELRREKKDDEIERAALGCRIHTIENLLHWDGQLQGEVFTWVIYIRNLWEDHGGKSLDYKAAGKLKKVLRESLERYFEINGSGGSFNVPAMMENPYISQNLPGEGQVSIYIRLRSIGDIFVPKELALKILKG